MKKENIIHYMVKIFMFIIFLYLFGEPSYNNFMRQGGVMKESKSNVRTFPAITICLVWTIIIRLCNISFLFQNGHFRNGLLDDSMDYISIFSRACGIKFSNISEFYKCVESQRYAEEEIILGTLKIKEVSKLYILNLFRYLCRR